MVNGPTINLWQDWSGDGFRPENLDLIVEQLCWLEAESR